VQTLFGVATTSNYTYGGSVRRKINDVTFWGGTFRATHSGLVQREGANSGSESFSSSLSWRRYAASATYTQSRGTSVLTPTGVLTPTPLAPLVTDSFIFFNARSVGVGGSAALFRRMTLSASYAKVHSDTASDLVHSINRAELYNARVEYKIRKLSFIGGFTRVDQGINISSTGTPTIVNSFYLSMSRWFNVF
jgi:hypothetical protein